jgi:hypothetical protein
VLRAVGERRRVGPLAPERKALRRLLVNVTRAIRIGELARERLAHGIPEARFEIGKAEADARRHSGAQRLLSAAGALAAASIDVSEAVAYSLVVPVAGRSRPPSSRPPSAGLNGTGVLPRPP